MALWVCTGCTAKYSVGAVRCPQCGDTEYAEEGAAEMPKITVHGGPSIAGASVVGGSWSSEGDPDVWPEPEEVGGEEPFPGSSSETSPEKPSSESETKPRATRKPAQTTASRSRRARTGSSSASGTAGDQMDATSETDSATDGEEG